jgi:hypothetical protein
VLNYGAEDVALTQPTAPLIEEETQIQNTWTVLERTKILSWVPTGPETNNECAGEDQQHCYTLHRQLRMVRIWWPPVDNLFLLKHRNSLSVQQKMVHNLFLLKNRNSLSVQLKMVDNLFLLKHRNSLRVQLKTARSSGVSPKIRQRSWMIWF